MNFNYLTRSLMFVPAHREHLLDKAIGTDADVLLLDLEDSCQPSENKVKARDNIVRYINAGKFNGRILFPRVNERMSGEMLKDISALTVDGVKGFMYPKATCGEDIYFFGKLLETFECEKGFPIGTFQIIPLIETPGALLKITDICTACPNRVVAIAFGHLDYVTELRGRHDKEGRSISMARAMIAAGARACGVVPIDTIHPFDVHDLVDLEKQLNIGKDLGYEGMLVLNPIELPLVHKYYSPSEKEVSDAKRILHLYQEAEKNGSGVAIMDGTYIGPPIVKQAELVIEKQKLIDKK